MNPISTTLISQILSGQRIFTTEQTHNLITLLNVNSLESQYIIFLNQWERSGTATLKEFWMKQLFDLKDKSRELGKKFKEKDVLSQEEKNIFYSTTL